MLCRYEGDTDHPSAPSEPLAPTDAASQCRPSACQSAPSRLTPFVPSVRQSVRQPVRPVLSRPVPSGLSASYPFSCIRPVHRPVRPFPARPVQCGPFHPVRPVRGRRTDARGQLCDTSLPTPGSALVGGAKAVLRPLALTVQRRLRNARRAGPGQPAVRRIGVWAAERARTESEGPSCMRSRGPDFRLNGAELGEGVRTRF